MKCNYNFAVLQQQKMLFVHFKTTNKEKYLYVFSDGDNARNREARERLSRRILTTIWSSLISYLNATLKTENGSSLAQNGNGSSANSIFSAKLARTSGQDHRLSEAGIRYSETQK
jgi:hypothetical protein